MARAKRPGFFGAVASPPLSRYREDTLTRSGQAEAEAEAEGGGKGGVMVSEEVVEL